MSCPIKVVNACKSYQSGSGVVSVLKNLCMSVDSSSIYGIFGESGGGKTTLLDCIMGLKRLDSGYISLYGKVPKDIENSLIGYMPQQLALYDHLTIFEIFDYFGKIFGLAKSRIILHSNELIDLLNLPKTSTILQNLSGGQRRRVSLGIALLNNPPILCLDECSVGTDPLVKERIWMHLRDLVTNNNTTIILTTHCTGELRLCDKIGIMRKGRIIAEDAPQAVLNMCGVSLLQDALKFLCVKDDKERQFNSQNLVCHSFEKTKEKLILNLDDRINGTFYQLQRNNYFTQITPIIINSKEKLHMPIDKIKTIFKRITSEARQLFAVTKRNLLYQFRQFATLAFQLLLPLIEVITCICILGKEPKGTNLCVFSQDVNCFSDGNVIAFNNNITSMSCRLLQVLTENGDMYFKEATSIDIAKLAVTSGTAIGYVNIPANFTQNFHSRLALKSFAEEQEIDGSTINLHLDMTNQIISKFLIETFIKGYTSVVSDLTTQFDVDKREAKFPLKFNSIFEDNKDEVNGWQQYFLPQMGPLTIFCLAICATCGLYAEDKQNGTFTRSLVAGLKIQYLLFSYYISATLIAIIQFGIVNCTIMYFGVLQLKGSFWLIFFLTILACWTGVSIALVIATCFSIKLENFITGIFVSCLLMITSGSLWPVESITFWFRTLCIWINPATFVGIASRGIWSKGWDIGNSVVICACMISLTWIMVCFFASIAIHRRQNK